MDDRWRLRLRYTYRGMAYAFVFPFVFIMVMSRSGVGLGPALLAGAFNAVTAGPPMTFLFAVLVPFTRRFPFLLAMLIQLVCFVGAGAVVIPLNVAIVVMAFNGMSPTDPRLFHATMEIVWSPDMRLAFSIGIALFFAMAVFEQVKRKLGGREVIWNWITGKYHRPREEERVFMFLDLKDSTPLAEKLGAVRFSSLIQEFFNDLGIAVFATRASVSHYIGDEAVIVWPVSQAVRKENCVRLFFKMQEEVAKRATFYRERFGLVPAFKAGVHMGPVVAAEVGRAKSEIVYHGDAVNTTARIVGMCAQLGQDLIVSKEIADRLAASPYRFEPLGTHALKGKSEPLELFAVKRG